MLFTAIYILYIAHDIYSNHTTLCPIHPHTFYYCVPFHHCTSYFTASIWEPYPSPNSPCPPTPTVVWYISSHLIPLPSHLKRGRNMYVYSTLVSSSPLYFRLQQVPSGFYFTPFITHDIVSLPSRVIWFYYSSDTFSWSESSDGISLWRNMLNVTTSSLPSLKDINPR